MKKLTLVLTVALATFSCIATAQAQTPPRGDGPPAGYGPAYGPGPGMMGGYGRGPGAYGPGMMRGYGPAYGPAYDQGYGYGSGMMGGYGRGGMMGGYGYGGGMMGLGPWQALDLNEQQLGKITQIQDETRRKNWSVMGKLMDEQAHMRDLFLTDKRDPAAIGKQAMKIADLRRQMLEASVDARNRAEALLTKEQKDQLRSWHRGWLSGEE